MITGRWNINMAEGIVGCVMNLYHSLISPSGNRQHDLERHLMQGKNKEESGKLESAIESYKAAIELDKNCFKAYLRIGDIEWLRSNYEIAIMHLDSALKINPKSSETLGIRARVNLILGSVDDAFRDASSSLEFDSNNKNALYAMINIYGLKKDNEKVKEFQERLNKAL